MSATSTPTCTAASPRSTPTGCAPASLPLPSAACSPWRCYPGCSVRRLTSDMVIRAATAAGLCTDKEPIAFIAPVARDGAGFVTTLDLPAGKTAADALKREEAIASGLGMSARRVFLESVPEEHAGRLKLWVADEDPFRGKPLSSPLLKAERFNFWDPIPVGVDARSRVFFFRMTWTSFLCGSVP